MTKTNNNMIHMILFIIIVIWMFLHSILIKQIRNFDYEIEQVITPAHYIVEPTCDYFNIIPEDMRDFNEGSVTHIRWIKKDSEFTPEGIMLEITNDYRTIFRYYPKKTNLLVNRKNK